MVVNSFFVAPLPVITSIVPFILSRELCYAILPQIELKNFSNNSLFMSNNFIILGNYGSAKR
jgi:hypothetical protein